MRVAPEIPEAFAQTRFGSARR